MNKMKGKNCSLTKILLASGRQHCGNWQDLFSALDLVMSDTKLIAYELQ